MGRFLVWLIDTADNDIPEGIAINERLVEEDVAVWRVKDPDVISRVIRPLVVHRRIQHDIFAVV